MTDIRLKKLEDESFKQYQIRICSNRDKYELSWQDVTDLLNKELGTNWGESKFRKHWYSFQEGLEYANLQNIESDEVLNELELKKIELLEERKKLQAIRSEYNKIARDKGRKDLLFEQLREGFELLDAPTPSIDLSSFVDTHQAHILSFGDIHFGKKFESFNNVYSEEIAMNRMEEIIKDTIRYANKNDIVDLDVLNLADSIEGMTLRTSQLQSLQSGFVDQVIKFSKFYAKWLRELSKHVRVNAHHITSSNHSELRPHNSGRGEYPAEDMERIIGMYIQDVLSEHENIKVNTYDNGIADFQLLDYNFIALHGHQIKNKKTAIKDLSVHRRKFYDFCYLAHFHHENILTVGLGETNDTKVIQVPSVMGSDSYSDSFFAGSKAGALISTFTKGKGLTDTHHIILN